MWLGVGKSVTAHTSGSWLAIAYLLVHLGMALLSQRAPAGLRKVLLVDILLIGWFAGIIRSGRPRRVARLEISESVVPGDLFLVGLQMGGRDPAFLL